MTTRICNNTYQTSGIKLAGTSSSSTANNSQVLQDVLNGQFNRAAHPEFQEIRCAIDEGIVTMLGTVQSFYYSQVAQEIVRRTAGVERVVNNVHVLRPC